MKTRVMATLSALALAAALAPLPSLAADATAQSYDLTTRQFDPQKGGEWDGRLRLRVSPAGIVSGTYIDTDGHMSQVVGGVDGRKIWFELHGLTPGGLVWNGTLENGKLVAYAHGRGLNSWTLEGTPKTH